MTYSLKVSLLVGGILALQVDFVGLS